MGRAGSSPAPGTQKGVLLEGVFFVEVRNRVDTRACNVKEVRGMDADELHGLKAVQLPSPP